MLHPVSFCSPIALDPVSKVFGIDVVENEGDDGAIVELCKGCDGGRRPREVERVYLACQFCWGGARSGSGMGLRVYPVYQCIRDRWVLCCRHCREKRVQVVRDKLRLILRLHDP
jgi:hypothetical protein